MAIDALRFWSPPSCCGKSRHPNRRSIPSLRAACTTTSRSVCGHCSGIACCARSSWPPSPTSLFLRELRPSLFCTPRVRAEISPVTLGIILAVGGIGAIPVRPSLRRRPSFWCWPDHHRRLADRYGNVAADSAGDRTARRAGAGGEHAAGRNRGNDRQRAAVEPAQLVTPDALQGRVTASHRFLVYGAYPIGALLGGWLGAKLGLRPAIALCALGALTAPVMGRLFTATAPAAAPTAASE